MNDEHLKASLVEFETAAKAVQASLLSRNTEQIWNALAQQEEAVRRLAAARSSSNELVGASSRDSGIQRLMERCQTVLRANRALAGRFLDVVDQTLSQLGGGRSRTATYAANPYASRRAAPLLVCQQG
ncbi:MAG: hypothetical protein JXR40_07605 [Pontiellaceae bacterium]|nr:hypothetical protein [Pontiellaceae bacterium]